MLKMSIPSEDILSGKAAIVQVKLSFDSGEINAAHPRQQKFRAMNGARLACPIKRELGYAHRPQLGSQIDCPFGNHGAIRQRRCLP